MDTSPSKTASAPSEQRTKEGLRRTPLMGEESHFVCVCGLCWCVCGEDKRWTGKRGEWTTSQGFSSTSCQGRDTELVVTRGVLHHRRVVNSPRRQGTKIRVVLCTVYVCFFSVEFS